MARIRTIKPEFWTDEKLAPLSPLTRLTFLGLVSMADDAGRLVDSVKLLDGLLFSETEDSVTESLKELETIGVIQRGLSGNGKKIIQIVGWFKHQKIEKINLKAALPPIEPEQPKTPPAGTPGGVGEESGNSQGGVGESSPPGSTIYDLGSTTDDQREGEGGEEGATPPPSPTKRGKGFQKAWERWKAHQRENFHPLTPTAEEAALMELSRCFPDDEAKQIKAIEFSILRRAKHLIITGEFDRTRGSPEDPASEAAKGKAIVDRMFGGVR